MVYFYKLGEIFGTLSQLPYKEHVMEKGSFRGGQGAQYIPWAKAVKAVMKVYPETTFSFKDVRRCDNDTVMVKTEVTIGETLPDGVFQGITRQQELPVQDHKFRAIPNPTANELNKAFQRCLVKNLAIFGYAIDLYGGEDPYDETVSFDDVANKTSKGSAKTPDKVENYLQNIKKTNEKFKGDSDD